MMPKAPRRAVVSSWKSWHGTAVLELQCGHKKSVEEFSASERARTSLCYCCKKSPRCPCTYCCANRCRELLKKLPANTCGNWVGDMGEPCKLHETHEGPCEYEPYPESSVLVGP